MFQFKGFQVQDYARASLTDGLVLAHDTGMGKSIASITWPLLKVGVDWETSRAKRGLYPNGRVLIVAPESLHLQMQNEWRAKFGISVTKLDSQDTYHKLSPLAPGWYVTSFTQLSDRLPAFYFNLQASSRAQWLAMKYPKRKFFRVPA